jgi:membrane protein
VEERPIQEAGLLPDLSPEARRKAALRWRAGLQERFDEHVGPNGRFWGTRVYRVIERVWTGVYHDGFIHAGNLAYMAILALFPFFVTVAAILSVLGESAQSEASVRAVLAALPPVVEHVLEPVLRDVMAARSGSLLWLGGLIGLWTVSSLIETIRDILHRAYGTPPTLAFWHARLVSSGMIVVAVVLLMLSLFMQVSISAAEEAFAAWLPQLDSLGNEFALSRVVTAAVLYLSIFMVFLSLTPSAYRGKAYPKWPGALLVTGWWVATTVILPVALRHVFTYTLTYGSLAGVMITLFFFWLVGLGMVVGAELNAALSVSPEERDMLGQEDNRARARRHKDGDTSE